MGDRGEADEGCDLLVVDGTKFGQFGDEHGPAPTSPMPGKVSSRSRGDIGLGWQARRGIDAG
nr:hypothetical protein [Rhizobium bangladeshense]